MKRKLSWAAGCAVVLAAMMGCQTEPTLVAPAQSEIQVEKPGFSPKGTGDQTTIGISLLFGDGDSIRTWKVEIVGNGPVQKTWSGDAAYLPSSLSWGGIDDLGNMSAEGKYRATLSIEYEKKFRSVSVESNVFVLDLTPPKGSIALDPAQFTPSEKGVTGPMTLTINASSALAAMDSWSMDIYGPAGGLVKSFSGQWPTASATWDGSELGGGFVSPDTIYTAVATVRDEYGNSAKLTARVPVTDIPLATQENRVEPEAAGFSPNSETMARSITLALTFGNRESVKSWTLTVAHSQMGAQMSWTGNGGDLPPSESWDGRTSSGSLAPEGTYTATLSVDFGKSYKPVLVKSTPFVLDVTPPAGNVAAVPSKLAPDGKGGIEPVTFTLYGNSEVAALESWSLEVLNSRGKVAASFEGQWPAAPVSWDGRLSGGGRANPTQKYTYLAKIRDEYGNTGEARGSLATGELPVVQGTVSVVPAAPGFSPNGDDVADTIELDLSYGQPAAVVSWNVSIAGSGMEAQYTLEGKGANPPKTLVWDGKTDSGATAPEGSYTATLRVNYGTVFAPASATSAPFVLDVTPPTGKITLSSPLFSPLEASDTMTLTLSASSPLAKIDSWTMDIYDPAGNLFRSFSDKWPADEAVWDGRGTDGEFVQSAEDYPVVATIRDQYGNTGTAKAVVPIDILVEKMGNGYRIRASRIFFKAFTADYKDVPPELAAQNVRRLDALADKLEKFPGYDIRIVGHAVSVYWYNKTLAKREQREVLIPLSKARADAVKTALVERGLQASRFSTEGVGAADQLVPDSDLRDRWQNRRVALYLEKR